MSARVAPASQEDAEPPVKETVGPAGSPTLEAMGGRMARLERKLDRALGALDRLVATATFANPPTDERAVPPMRSPNTVAAGPLVVVSAGPLVVASAGALVVASAAALVVASAGALVVASAGALVVASALALVVASVVALAEALAGLVLPLALATAGGKKIRGMFRQWTCCDND